MINCVHVGLPQNRPRVFIVGFHKEKCPRARKFRWPQQAARPPRLSTMLCGGRVLKKVKAKTRAFQRVELVRKAIAEQHCSSSSIDRKPYAN